MTKEQLDAIRARVEAATPGPWEPSSDTLTWIHVEAHGLTVAECRTYLNRQHTDAQNDANAEFIAKAREDVPALLAEVERLTADPLPAAAWVREVERAAFQRGAAAMREKIAAVFDADVFPFSREVVRKAIRALPDPEDK